MERQKLKKSVQKKDSIRLKSKVPRKPKELHVMDGDVKGPWPEIKNYVKVERLAPGLDKIDPINGPWIFAGLAPKVRGLCCWENKMFMTTTDNKLFIRDNEPGNTSVNAQWIYIGPSIDNVAITAYKGMLYSINENGILHSRHADGSKREWYKALFKSVLQVDSINSIIDLASTKTNIYALTNLRQIWRLDESAQPEGNPAIWRLIHQNVPIKSLAASWRFGKKFQYLYGSNQKNGLVVHSGSKWVNIKSNSEHNIRTMAGTIYSPTEGALFIATDDDKLWMVKANRL